MCLSTILVLVACKEKEVEMKRFESTFLGVFDTQTTVVGYAKDKEQYEEYSQFIYDRLNYYHKIYDKYNDYEGINNIKTINDNAGIGPVKVEQEVIDLLQFSIEAAEFSEGKINIAMGSVLEVWHDYRTEGVADPTTAKLPPMEVLEEKNNHTNIDDIIIDEEKSTVYLQDKEMRLDVGAIAKGYGTERVALEVQKEGFTSGMLSVGGNVRTLGPKADNGENWYVGIQNPDLESEEANIYILSIHQKSLVTSGDYERYYTVDGQRYHHLIDPVTLMPATYFKAVSIICKDSGMADALSTTLFNLPYEEGLALVETFEDTEAVWVMPDGEQRYSSGFEALVKQ